VSGWVERKRVMVWKTRKMRGTFQFCAFLANSTQHSHRTNAGLGTSHNTMALSIFSKKSDPTDTPAPRKKFISTFNKILLVLNFIMVVGSVLLMLWGVLEAWRVTFNPDTKTDSGQFKFTGFILITIFLWIPVLSIINIMVSWFPVHKIHRITFIGDIIILVLYLVWSLVGLLVLGLKPAGVLVTVWNILGIVFVCILAFLQVFQVLMNLLYHIKKRLTTPSAARKRNAKKGGAVIDDEDFDFDSI